MTPRPTQKQVAELAGVSQTVVSQVLNGQTRDVRISPETRDRVLRVIQDLGYVPNAAARRLVGGRSSLVGVFTYEAVFPSSTRDFYAPFLEGIEEEAARHHLDLLLYTGYAGVRKSLSKATGQRLALTDGTLMLGHPDREGRQELAALIRSGHPVVFIGRRDIPGVDVAYVQVDYVSATSELTWRFQELGHRQTLYIGRPELSESAVDREQGYRLAATHPEIKRMEIEELDHAFLRSIANQGITGVLLENDALMRQFLQESRRAGYEVPGHFSAAVLGNAITGNVNDPDWTRLRLPRKEMGRGALQSLLAKIEGQPFHSLSFACEIVPGNTIGSPATQATIRGS